VEHTLKLLSDDMDRVEQSLTHEGRNMSALNQYLSNQIVEQEKLFPVVDPIISLRPMPPAELMPHHQFIDPLLSGTWQCSKVVGDFAGLNKKFHQKEIVQRLTAFSKFGEGKLVYKIQVEDDLSFRMSILRPSLIKSLMPDYNLMCTGCSLTSIGKFIGSGDPLQRINCKSDAACISWDGRVVTTETEGLILDTPLTALDGGERMRTFDRLWIENEGGGELDETSQLVHEVQVDDVLVRRIFCRRQDPEAGGNTLN
jgi:hypothetical protein